MNISIYANKKQFSSNIHKRNTLLIPLFTTWLTDSMTLYLVCFQPVDSAAYFSFYGYAVWQG